MEMIGTHQQVLLYGKSGLGKSSLINAGIIPRLLKATAHGAQHILPIRIGAYVDSSSPTPLQAMHAALPPASPTFLDRIIPEDNSLWHHFKAISLLSKEHPVYYLIFDQFEELFSHPPEAVFAFKKHLARVLYAIVPQYFKTVLEHRQRENEDVLSGEELIRLYMKPEVKVLYAIREDRYSELNGLADYLPDILHRRYELRPLDREKAQEAIERPGLLTGDFQGGPFRYSPTALAHILDFLSCGQHAHVETTQLQILCNHIERRNKEMITLDDVPRFDDIFLQFYEDSIACLAPEDREPTQDFIERKMIINGHRIAYHELACLEGMSSSALDLLLRDRHLLRTERSSTGGITYELSHDTLVPPITAVRLRREAAEAELAAAKAQEAAELARIQKEHEREADAKRLKHELSIAQAIHIRELRRLRNTRLALMGTVLACSLAIAALVYATDQKREAQEYSEQLKRTKDSLDVSLQEAEQSQHEAETARQAAESARQNLVDAVMPELIAKARKFLSYGSPDIAKEWIDSAVGLDPKRVDLYDSLAKW